MKMYVNSVDKHRKLILDAFDYIWKHPETGYKEVVTSNYMAEQFIRLGYDIIILFTDRILTECKGVG